MSIYTYHYQIKYSDVDQNNRLTLKSLVALLQEGAAFQSVNAGYSVNDIPKTHSAWIVLNWKVQFFKHPHAYEKLIVQTWPRTMDALFSYRDFEVYDDQQALIAIASSKWVLVETQTKKIKKIQPEVAEAYGGITNKAVFDKPWEEKINVPEKLSLRFKYTVQRRDIDTNGHVNNLHYIDYALETLDEKIYSENCFDNIEIIYKKEIKYKEKIRCYYTYQNNMHIITIKNEDDSIIHAIVKLFS